MADAHGLAKAVADAEVKYHAIAAAPAPQPLSEEQKREIILRIIGKDDPVSAITAYRIIHETLHMLSPSPQQDGPSDAEMLDWLEADMRKGADAVCIEFFDRKFCYPYMVSPAGGFGGGVGEARFDTLREAIRAAMRGDTGGQP